MNRARRLASISFALAVTGAMFLRPSAASAQDTRRAVTGSIALEVNGTQVGFLRSAEGGEVKGEVVSEMSSSFPKKRIAATKIEDLTLELGPDMDKSVYDWIAASWQGSSSPASGAVLLVNYDSNVMARREFSTASIVGTTIPGLDASSKEPGSLALTLRPQSVRITKGAGMVSPTLGGKKAWLTSNFKVELPGLDCAKVRKVGGFTVKMNPTQFPDLKLTLPESSAETWIAWHKSFVVDGNNGEGAEKDGAIIFLAADGQTEMGRVSLSHVGISALHFDSVGAGSAIPTVTAELYCESMAFQWTGATASGAVQLRTLIR